MYCFNPNKPKKKPDYYRPEEALSRVATVIKGFARDAKDNPKDYVVNRNVMWFFFTEFKSKVFDEALRQDEAMGGHIKKMEGEYRTQKAIAMKEAREEAAKAAEKAASRSTVFLSQSAVSSAKVVSQ